MLRGQKKTPLCYSKVKSGIALRWPKLPRKACSLIRRKGAKCVLTFFRHRYLSFWTRARFMSALHLINFEFCIIPGKDTHSVRNSRLWINMEPLEQLYHRLTLPKGVHVYSFRYFLSPMRIPNLVMHMFILPITKGFGIMNSCISRFDMRIGDRKYLNEYTPFGSVSLWYIYGRVWLVTLNRIWL